MTLEHVVAECCAVCGTATGKSARPILCPSCWSKLDGRHRGRVTRAPLARIGQVVARAAHAVHRAAWRKAVAAGLLDPLSAEVICG